MKQINRYLMMVTAALLLLCVQACSRRSTLSDRELAQVFHDAFLANAYTSAEGIRLDSLRLYEPIFQQYGYTTEDVQYSIGNFSMRKSARLSDVVERAISMLEARGKELDKEVAILDTVDNIAKRLTVRRIYSDSLRTYRSREDSLGMVVVVEPIEAGNYRIEFDYLIDTLDKTAKNYLMKSWFEVDHREGEEPVDDRGRKLSTTGMDSAEIAKYISEPRKKSQNNTTLRKRSIDHHTSQITVDSTASRLVVCLAQIAHDDEKEHHARVKNISISRLLTADEAQDSLFRAMVYVNIFDDELLFPQPQKDSL